MRDDSAQAAGHDSAGQAAGGQAAGGQAADHGTAGGAAPGRQPAPVRERGEGRGRGPVVAGVDGSEHARSAALWAAGEAEMRGVPLRLVYAVDLDRMTRLASPEVIDGIYADGHELLVGTAAAVRDRFPDLTVRTELNRKEPVAALRAAGGPGDLVVVGNRGLGGFGTLMLGSVGLGVATRAQGPVAVVREDADARRGVVVAAVRGVKDHDWLDLAAGEAEMRGAELRLLSAWSPLSHVGTAVSFLDDLGKMAEEHARKVEAVAGDLRWAHPGLTVTSEVTVGGSAAAALVEGSGSADLVVVGGRRRPLRLGPGLGKVAHALVHHAHCPVMVAPRAQAPDREER
ncbi:universal stress protein [Streptomyces fradiae]|uniref:universal stress protein n=1 Tax=Streptomyces fradiae TaxID=1906 RepID=UPI0033BFF668